MNTFKIGRRDIDMFIYSHNEDTVLELSNKDGEHIRIFLDEYSMDQLRNYLDDLEADV